MSARNGRSPLTPVQKTRLREKTTRDSGVPDAPLPRSSSAAPEGAALLRQYGILGAPAEPALEDLARLAAVSCRTPYALVSVIDGERHWVKASVGWPHQEMACGDFFCHDAPPHPDLFQVPNAAEDPRFCALPCVSDPPGVRFYAGVPLLTEDGALLGTVCVLDTAPRFLEEEQQRALRLLARQAMALLELRRQALQLADAMAARSDTEDAARWQARHDPLTGLPNRILFQERLEEALATRLATPTTRRGRAGSTTAAAARKARAAAAADTHAYGEELAVLFVDLDRFKRINDTLGHASGDLLLREVASRFSGCLRPEDTLARMGGDEFTVLLPRIPGQSYAVSVSQMLLRTLRRPIQVGAQEFHVGASIGISLCPRDGEESQSLLKHADIAMYQAKAGGGGGCQVYARRMNEGSYQRLVEEAELRRALERDELSLCFQPQIDLMTGEIRAVEALARWHHPERGPVPPAHFIPLAEQADLIVELGEWALRRACVQAARWRAEGHSHLRVAVNLSARHMMQPRLVDRLAQMLEETGLPGNGLDIELTESSLCRGSDPTPQTLQALRAMGIRLSVDDFGTGYSSLAYLRRFPVDILKIDRTFVAALGGGAETAATDEALVRACIEMAHALGAKVVAEGVETEAQVARLKALDCDLVQGYLYSRPVPAETLQSLLRAGRIRRRLRGLVPSLTHPIA